MTRWCVGFFFCLCGALGLLSLIVIGSDRQPVEVYLPEQVIHRAGVRVTFPESE